MKTRFLILFVTILVSIGFYFLITPTVIYFLNFTSVKGAVVSFIPFVILPIYPANLV